MLAKARNIKPSLLVVQDSKGCVFGAYVPDVWKPQGGYYGAGQTFVFSFHNNTIPKAQRNKDVSKFKVYRWTHENKFFQNVTDTYVAVGGGGAFAVYLVSAYLRVGVVCAHSQKLLQMRWCSAQDSELFVGSSGPCGTFGSPCLASGADFECYALELWTFVP